ncbi:hypothetical protein IT570_02375 [Candidatus Sumerlaeota bacterium]|nr:hypothetical protein [Candidatus Sumerlaeota bacterium]
MELKQMVMLGVLLTVAVVGSAFIIYVLSHLDKDEEEDEHKDADGHEHGH